MSKEGFGCQGLRKNRNIRSAVVVSFEMAKEVVQELGDRASVNS